MFPGWITNFKIEYAVVSPVLPEPNASGVLWQAGAGRFLLNLPGIARYYAENGSLLRIDRDSTAGEQDVIRVARSTPLAALLYQRGMLVFHAAALVPPSHQWEDNIELKDESVRSSAVIIAGDSGAGKSTLLLRMLQLGWKMLSDDLTAVGLNENRQPVIYPLTPEILLWKQTADKLKLEQSAASGNLANGKLVYSFDRNFYNQPVPLGKIYSLHVRSGIVNVPQHTRGSRYFSVINSLLYNSHIADALIDRSAHFTITSALSKTVPIQQLNRPRGEWHLNPLVDQIQAGSIQ